MKIFTSFHNACSARGVMVLLQESDIPEHTSCCGIFPYDRSVLLSFLCLYLKKVVNLPRDIWLRQSFSSPAGTHNLGSTYSDFQIIPNPKPLVLLWKLQGTSSVLNAAPSIFHPIFSHPFILLHGISLDVAGLIVGKSSTSPAARPQLSGTPWPLFHS